MPDAALSLIFLAALLRPTVNAPIVEYTDGPSRAFGRYIAGLQHPTAWSVESIEIEASLPKLQKHGRLRAIRRLNPLGEANYEVLESAGDQTVRREVIARYLSAQAAAAEIPASTVAMSPVNYDFSYKGVGKIGETVAYVFQIRPRKKREGLIKGELWLDGETGAAIHMSGYLVKKPSIFVKRVTVSRETLLSEGIAQTQLTHLSVETRLVGLADLTITERPWRY